MRRRRQHGVEVKDEISRGITERQKCEVSTAMPMPPGER